MRGLPDRAAHFAAALVKSRPFGVRIAPQQAGLFLYTPVNARHTPAVLGRRIEHPPAKTDR